jgi:hypothetical protein
MSILTPDRAPVAPSSPSGRGSSLPRARGPLSARLLAYLAGDSPALHTEVVPADGVLESEDAQLALYCCYELHYRGFAGVDPELEWDTDVLTLRAGLERRSCGT